MQVVTGHGEKFRELSRRRRKEHRVWYSILGFLEPEPTCRQKFAPAIDSLDFSIDTCFGCVHGRSLTMPQALHCFVHLRGFWSLLVDTNISMDRMLDFIHSRGYFEVILIIKFQTYQMYEYFHGFSVVLGVVEEKREGITNLDLFASQSRITSNQNKTSPV